LTVQSWQDDLKLYPQPADSVFGRSFRVVALLEPAGQGA
jgi:hypothetical protein